MSDLKRAFQSLFMGLIHALTDSKKNIFLPRKSDAARETRVSLRPFHAPVCSLRLPSTSSPPSKASQRLL